MHYHTKSTVLPFSVNISVTLWGSVFIFLTYCAKSFMVLYFIVLQMQILFCTVCLLKSSCKLFLG